MKKEFRQALFVLTTFVLLALIHLFIYTQNISLKYQLTELKVKLSESKSKNRALGAQVAQKENLAYLEQAAREKLGMVYPEKINYILPGRPAEAGKATP